MARGREVRNRHKAGKTGGRISPVRGCCISHPPDAGHGQLRRGTSSCFVRSFYAPGATVQQVPCNENRHLRKNRGGFLALDQIDRRNWLLERARGRYGAEKRIWRGCRNRPVAEVRNVLKCDAFCVLRASSARANTVARVECVNAHHAKSMFRFGVHALKRVGDFTAVVCRATLPGWIHGVPRNAHPDPPNTRCREPTVVRTNPTAAGQSPALRIPCNQV